MCFIIEILLNNLISSVVEVQMPRPRGRSARSPQALPAPPEHATPQPRGPIPTSSRGPAPPPPQFGQTPPPPPSQGPYSPPPQGPHQQPQGQYYFPPMPDMTAFHAFFQDMTQIGQAMLQNQTAQAPTPQQQEPQMGPRFYFGEMKRARVPTFEGHSDPDAAEKWLDEIENCFELIQVLDDMKAQVIRPFLIGEANQWWKTNLQPLPRPIPWTRFLEEFFKFYIPPSVTLQKMGEFEALKQEPGMTVADYANRFTALGRYVPSTMGDERLKMLKFERGLNSRIRTWLVNANPENFGKLLGACYWIERDIIRRDDEAKGKRPRESGGTPSGRWNKAAKKTGAHSSRQIRTPQRQPQQNQQPAIQPCPTCHKQHLGECMLKTGGCFKCGKIGHIAKECPEPRKGAPQQQPRNKPWPNARVHVMTDTEVETTPDVVTGTLSTSI